MVTERRGCSAAPGYSGIYHVVKRSHQLIRNLRALVVVDSCWNLRQRFCDRMTTCSPSRSTSPTRTRWTRRSTGSGAATCSSTTDLRSGSHRRCGHERPVEVGGLVVDEASGSEFE